MRHVVGFLPVEVSRWKKNTHVLGLGQFLLKSNFHFWFSQSFGHRTDESKGSNFVESTCQIYINFCLSCSIL